MGTLRKRRFEKQLDLFRASAPEPVELSSGADEVMCRPCYEIPRHIMMHLVHLAIMNKRYGQPLTTADAIVREAIQQYLERIKEQA